MMHPCKAWDNPKQMLVSSLGEYMVNLELRWAAHRELSRTWAGRVCSWPIATTILPTKYKALPCGTGECQSCNVEPLSRQLIDPESRPCNFEKRFPYVYRCTHSHARVSCRYRRGSGRRRVGSAQ